MDDPENQQLARRNIRTALMHACLALGFLIAFVWSVSHR